MVHAEHSCIAGPASYKCRLQLWHALDMPLRAPHDKPVGCAAQQVPSLGMIPAPHESPAFSPLLRRCSLPAATGHSSGVNLAGDPPGGTPTDLDMTFEALPTAATAFTIMRWSGWGGVTGVNSAVDDSDPNKLVLPIDLSQAACRKDGSNNDVPCDNGKYLVKSVTAHRWLNGGGFRSGTDPGSTKTSAGPRTQFTFVGECGQTSGRAACPKPGSFWDVYLREWASHGSRPRIFKLPPIDHRLMFTSLLHLQVTPDNLLVLWLSTMKTPPPAFRLASPALRKTMQRYGTALTAAYSNALGSLQRQPHSRCQQPGLRSDLAVLAVETLCSAYFLPVHLCSTAASLNVSSREWCACQPCCPR